MDPPYTLRERLRAVVFLSNSAAGRAFDIGISLLIFFSLICVILESVPSLAHAYHHEFLVIEWVFTALFTIEYVVRVYAARPRLAYVFSFFGIIDLISTLPLYLSHFVPGAQSAMVVRGLRLLRLFRLFSSQGRWAEHGGLVITAVRASLPKVAFFLGAVTMVAMMLGTVIYLIEGGPDGFTSIPQGMYWAISTLTTVGYGDVVPRTTIGQVIASVVMVLGYGVVAIPVGIVSSDIAQSVEAHRRRLECPRCEVRGHAADSRFCRKCGYELRVGASSGGWSSVAAPVAAPVAVQPGPREDP
ncbi:MAG: ion transporter [Deltaproteobacteria bacterium]|nr:ion transporter [Nannocystaceae bacterium]